MLGRRSSLRELIRTQHEESRRYLEKRDQEIRSRDSEIRARQEEIQAHNAEFRAYVEESRAARAKSDRLFEEMREFNREILLRNEKVYKSVIAEMEKGRRQLEEGTKQIQANTRAVLSVLDRLDGSGSAVAS